MTEVEQQLFIILKFDTTVIWIGKTVKMGENRDNNKGELTTGLLHQNQHKTKNT